MADKSFKVKHGLYVDGDVTISGTITTEMTEAISESGNIFFSFNKYLYRSGTMTIQFSKNSLSTYITYFGLFSHDGEYNASFNTISSMVQGSGYIVDYWYPQINGENVEFVAFCPVDLADPVKIRILPNLLEAEVFPPEA
jgi:hypothetical protein